MVVVGQPISANLAAALRPSLDISRPHAAAIGSDTIDAVLACIGLGAQPECQAWVDATGRWHLGVTAGSWTKPAAEFVGYGSHEAARRRRLAELDAEIAAAEAALHQAMADVEAVEARQLAVQCEFARAPKSDVLCKAHRDFAEAQRRVVVAEERVARERGDRYRADRRASFASAVGPRQGVRFALRPDRAATEVVDTAATDLALPRDRAGLEACLEEGGRHI